MTGRIVLFGATGYTGLLAAEEMVATGLRPVLAGRSAERLADLSLRLSGPEGPLPSAVADVAYPSTVHALVKPGDVLVSTVGPFTRFGEPALQAAVQAGGGSVYIDSTGEPTFLADVYRNWHRPAQKSGATLIPAMGYDFVPGQLAAALALDRSQGRGRRVEVGYFFTGKGLGGATGGTEASMAGQLLERHYVRRDGRLVPERAAAHARTFHTGGKDLAGLSLGSSEHFTLPRSFPEVRDVNVYLGWFGPHVRPLQVGSFAGDIVGRVPGVRRGLHHLTGKLVKTSTGGPDAATREQSGSLAVAETFDESGSLVQRVTVEGPNGYTLTGRLLAWSAARAAQQGTVATGAIGPIEAFGLEAFTQGCRDAGLIEV